MTAPRSTPHALATAPDPALRDKPCIEGAFSDGHEHFTVADYDALKGERYNQSIWLWRAPEVHDLTTQRPPEGWDVHISDVQAYNAQMRVLIGLD